MKLADYTVHGFADEMASDSPAPGGGSASALCGAQAAALLSMVCLLTVGKKKYADVWGLAETTQKKAAAIKDTFVDIIDRDTEAFNAVSAVFAMPKETEEEKAARKAAMQEALKGCTVTPLEMMRLSAEGLELIESVFGKLNASAGSDLGCAILNFRSALEGAWLNVLINIGGISDEDFCAECRRQGETYLFKSRELSDRMSAKLPELL